MVGPSKSPSCRRSNFWPPRVQARGARLSNTSFLRCACVPQSSEPYALEMVRLCLECVPAALFARGRTGVYLRKRAIWAHSLRSSFHCLPLLLCSFLLTLGLTRALFSCFGRRPTRDRGFFHLKLVVDGPVNGRLAGRRLRFSRALQLLSSSTSGRAPRVRSDRLW